MNTDDRSGPTAARQHVRRAATAIGQADGHVDRDDKDRAVSLCLSGQITDLCREVGARATVVKRDSDPPGLARINTQHSLAFHGAWSRIQPARC
jgi:hypothetical protein